MGWDGKVRGKDGRAWEGRVESGSWVVATSWSGEGIGCEFWWGWMEGSGMNAGGE